jgi:hypothetical protein
VLKRTRATVPSRFKGNLFRCADVNAGVSTTFVQNREAHLHVRAAPIPGCKKLTTLIFFKCFC